MWSRAQAVKHVLQRAQRVSQGHPGSGEPHDGLHLFPLLFLVTMNRTTRTGGLVLTVRTFFQPLFRITQKIRARLAQPVTLLLVMMGAVDSGHAFQRGVFPFQSSGQRAHCCSIPRPISV